MTQERPTRPDIEGEGDHERWRRPGRERRHRRYASTRLFWGLVLTWLGVSFFLREQGVISGGDWWKYFVMGLGGIFLVDSGVRYGASAFTGTGQGRVVAGVILIAVGAAFLIGGSWWPVILIAIGLLILLNSLLRRA